MHIHSKPNRNRGRDELDLAFEREENRELGVLLLILASPTLILLAIFLIKKLT